MFFIPNTGFWNSAGDKGKPFIFSVTVPSNSKSFQLPTVSNGIYDAKIDW